MKNAKEISLLFRYRWPLNTEAKSHLAHRLPSMTFQFVFQSRDITLSMPDRQNVESTTTMLASSELVDALARAGLDGEKFEAAFRDQLRPIYNALANAARRLVETLKFYLDDLQISEYKLSAFPRYEWSLDGESWQPCPVLLTCGTPKTLALPGYHGDLQERVATILASEEPPVLSDVAA